MKTYSIPAGSKLVFSADMAPWQTVAFQGADFKDPVAATAAELAAALNRTGALACYSDPDGLLVLASVSRGSISSLEIDLAGSTAASGLGLTLRTATSNGTGLSAACLIGQAAEPFAVPDGAHMAITVDDTKSEVVFEGLEKGASADEVAGVLDAQLPGIARSRRDGRLMLVSPTAGPDSMLKVEAGSAAEGKPDAAVVLGFTGISAFSRPVSSDPARLLCTGKVPGLRLVNLTASPIQLHFSTGTAMLPARGSIAVGPAEAGRGPLQQMAARGLVRLAQED